MLDHPCPECEGTGFIGSTDEDCPNCDGLGYLGLSDDEDDDLFTEGKTLALADMEEDDEE